MQIRYPAVAGAFYPDQPQVLKKLIQRLLQQAQDPEITNRVKGLIIPHAGYIYSGSVAACGYKLLKEERELLSKVILIGPAHHIPIKGPVFSQAEVWQTPLGQIKTLSHHFKTFNDLAHQPEHSLEVQLPFLQTLLKNFRMLPILINDNEQSEKLANNLLSFLGKDTLLIASSDLSHFHSEETAKEIDSLANRYIPSLNIEKTKKEVEACGLAAILVIMFLARKFHWQCQLLKYQTSAAVTGNKYQVVGYGAYAFTEAPQK